MIKTFRGALIDSAEERIRLGTIKGKVGYRIIKFQIMTQNFVNAELILKIWKTSGHAGDGVATDFSDNELLAAAQWSSSSAGESNPEDLTVIFDNEIFNQDIYITNDASSNAQTMNYYLELEVITLNDQGAEYTTIKDLRSNA